MKKYDDIQMEFIKNKNEIDFVAKLLINLCSAHNEQFIFLKGDIGSGKTSLVKAIAKEFNETENIISPTFNKMFVYENIVHIDAYNLENQSLNSYEDYFEDKLVIIEWAQLLKDYQIMKGFEVEIIYLNENERKYIIKWKG